MVRGREAAPSFQRIAAQADMKSSLIFLSFLALFGQPDASEWVLTPQLAAGTELVYAGTCTEQSLLPGVQYSRTYRVENHVLILASELQTHDVAFMTTLSARDAADPTKYSAASVKADVGRLDANGKLRLAGPPSTLLEIGCFVEGPAGKVGKNSTWEVDEEGRPPRSWVVLGTESCGGLACIKLQGQQQSEDWDRPRADRTAWRRRDIIWLSTQLGVAVKVERALERRDPARREPSHVTSTKYVLESRLRYPGRLFDDRKREVLQAKRFTDDATPLFAQAAQNAPQIDVLLRKVAYHLENTPSTPYRKAVVHLAQRVESARKGELLLAEYTAEEPATPIGPIRFGQKVPDTVLTDLLTRKTVRLSRMLGRPTLVVYYNPGTKTGVEVLDFAKHVADKFGDRVTILAMAVTNDPDAARQQHADLKLPFAIHNGSALRLSFAVEATPRFVVLDGEGFLRNAITGWAPHVGEDLLDDIARCGNPPRPMP